MADRTGDGGKSSGADATGSEVEQLWAEGRRGRPGGRSQPALDSDGTVRSQSERRPCLQSLQPPGQSNRQRTDRSVGRRTVRLVLELAASV